jgi:hypothetical protein
MLICIKTPLTGQTVLKAAKCITSNVAGPVHVGLFCAGKITTYKPGDKVRRRTRLSHASTDEL